MSSSTGTSGSSSGAAGAGPLSNLVLDPTYEAIAVSVNFDSEANSATAYLEFKETSGGTWQRGLDLIRPPAGPISSTQAPSGAHGIPLALRWVGSVFFLDANTSYDIRVTSKNSAGVVNGVLEGTVATAHWSWPEDTGRKFYVSTAGSDANDGSQAHPFATVDHAASVATTAGDTVHILPGTYFESIQLRASGTEGSPISFVGDGPGVIIDGSVASPPTNWVAVSSGGFSVDFPSYDPVTLFMDDHVRMFKHASLSALQSGTSWSNDYWNTSPITDGWAYAGGKLYVKLAGNADPSTHSFHISRWSSSSSSYGSGYGFLVGGRKWISFRNLTFQYGYYGVKIKTLSNASPNQYIRVADSTFWNQKYAIDAEKITAFNVYEGNQFKDTKVAEWPWNAHKVAPNETCAIKLAVDGTWAEAHANVIRNNLVDGAANGICAQSKNTDIHGNTIKNIADDAFEPDTAYGTLPDGATSDNSNLFFTENLRFYNNQIDTVFDGISLAPLNGVTFILGNSVTNFKVNAIKHDGAAASWGPIMLWNNSFWSNYSRGSLGTTYVMKIGPNNWNHDFQGNVAYARDYGLYALSGASLPITANMFDYNLWYTVGSNFWSLPTGSYSSLAQVRAAIPAWEAHGLEPASDPTSTFINAATGDLHLGPGSPAIDVGRWVPGVHCPQSDSAQSGQRHCVHWNGAAPDMGAWER